MPTDPHSSEVADILITLLRGGVPNADQDHQCNSCSENCGDSGVNFDVSDAPQSAPGRQAILREVEGIICKDRNAQHGEPEDLFSPIAGLWETYLVQRGIVDPNGEPLLAHDVAALMVLFKIARHAANPMHRDNAIDTVGYAAIMGELAGH